MTRSLVWIAAACSALVWTAMAAAQNPLNDLPLSDAVGSSVPLTADPVTDPSLSGVASEQSLRAAELAAGENRREDRASQPAEGRVWLTAIFIGGVIVLGVIISIFGLRRARPAPLSHLR